MARLLLTYLNNTTYVECVDESPSLSLKDLIKAFNGFKGHEIIECLWAMYDLISLDDWNHLITFASSRYVSKEHLYHEKRKIESNSEEVYDYSKFRITCAGKIYLTNICIHFEFFSCRIFGIHSLPLFSEANLRNKDYERIIEKVFTEVKNCCVSLNRSVEGINGICRNLHSYYNFKTESNIYQYHSERIIFSHIGYLDTYRCYILEESDEYLKINNVDRISFSLYLIKVIEDYINLFDTQCAKCSNHGITVLKSMKKAVKIAKQEPDNPKKTINYFAEG